MNFKNIFKRRVKVSEQKDVTAEDLGMDSNGVPKYDVNNAYQSVSVVYGCVNAIATNIAMLPINSYSLADKDYKKPLVKSKVIPLIYADQDDLIRDILISMYSFGVAYVEKKQSISGKIYDLDIVKFENISKQGNNYRITEGNNTRMVSAEGIMIFKTPNPYDNGILSPIQAAYKMMSADNEARIYQEKLFKNGVLSTGVVKIDNNFNVDDKIINKIKNQFASNYTGRRNIGKPIVLQGAEFTPISMPIKDIQMLDLKKATVTDIMMIYKVPPIELGLYENANYKVETQRKLFWENTLLPIISYIEKTFNIYFKSIGEEIKFDITDVSALQQDYNTKIDTAEKLLRMGFTLAQINEKLNLGFDTAKLDWKDDYLGSVPLANHTTPTKEVKTDDDDDDNSIQMKLLNTLNSIQNTVEETDKYIKEENVYIKEWNIFDKSIKQYEDDYEKKLSKYIYDLRKNVLSNVNEHIVSTEIVGMVDWGEQNKKLVNISDPFITKTFIDNYKHIVSQIKGKEFMYSRDSLLKILEKRFETLKITNKTIQKELYTAIAKGQGVDKTVRAIKDVMNIAKGRVKTIVQTNLIGTANEGRHIAMKDNDIEEQEWISTPDSKTRDSHIALNGEVVKLDEPFSNGLLFPGDPNGDVSEVINCRCTIKAVVEE